MKSHAPMDNIVVWVTITAFIIHWKYNDRKMRIGRWCAFNFVVFEWHNIKIHYFRKNEKSNRTRMPVTYSRLNERCDKIRKSKFVSFYYLWTILPSESETHLSTGKLHSELNRNVIQHRLFNAFIDALRCAVADVRYVLHSSRATIKKLVTAWNTSKRMHHPHIERQRTNF